MNERSDTLAAARVEPTPDVQNSLVERGVRSRMYRAGTITREAHVRDRAERALEHAPAVRDAGGARRPQLDTDAARRALVFALDEARRAARDEASVVLEGARSEPRTGYREDARDPQRGPVLRMRLRAGLEAWQMTLVTLAALVGLPALFHVLDLGANIALLVAMWVPLLASTVTRERELLVTRDTIVIDPASPRARTIACPDASDLHRSKRTGSLRLGSRTLLRGALPAPFIARLPSVVRAFRAFAREDAP